MAEQKTAEQNAKRQAKQLAYDQLHIIEWAERTLWLADPRTGRLGALRLNSKQKRWLTEATRLDAHGNLVHKTVIASTPKREGKSLLVSILIAHRLCCFIMERSIILANSERQAASNIFDELLGFFHNSPGLGDYATQDDLQTRSISVRASGSDVICVPCNYRTIQGIKVSGVLGSDELAAAADFMPFSFLSSQTESAHAQIALSTQAGAPVEANPVWRLYQAARKATATATAGTTETQRAQRTAENGDGRDGAAGGTATARLGFDEEAETGDETEWLGGEGSIFFWYMQEHFAPWAIKLAEDDRAKDLPSEWAYKHQNAWAGMGEKLFSAELVGACALDYHMPQTKADWLSLLASWGHAGKPWCIGVGLDRAGVSRSGDRSVWSVTARLDVGPGRELYRLVMLEVLETGSEEEVLDCERRTWEIFGRPAAVNLEYYGCSDLAEKVKGAELVVPTPKWQKAAFTAWYRLLKERRYGFPQDAGIDPQTGTTGLLKGELIAFESSGAGVSMKFGTQSGSKDDTVYSSLHSAFSLAEVKTAVQHVGAVTGGAAGGGKAGRNIGDGRKWRRGGQR